MKKVLTWSLFHAAHWAVLYGAFAFGLDGAMYVLKFCVWAMLPLAFMLLLDDHSKPADSIPFAPARSALTRIKNWATLGSGKDGGIFASC